MSHLKLGWKIRLLKDFNSSDLKKGQEGRIIKTPEQNGGYWRVLFDDGHEEGFMGHMIERIESLEDNCLVEFLKT